MTPTKTKVRITPTGMMDYLATYSLPNDKVTEFELTVKAEHLDDLLTTLRVRGDVSMPQPLTFTSPNADDSKLKIALDNPIGSIFQGMPGAKVEINVGAAAPKLGRIMGVDSVPTDNGHGRVINTRYLVLESDQKISRHGIDSIFDFSFVEEADRQEVQKALDKLNAVLRPGTTLVRFGLQGKSHGNGNTPASLQWVEPNAAPLMTYRLSISKANKFTLDGWATIHNFTNQSWKETTVELINGFPHTFKGFAADAVVPVRKEVRLVDANAVGGRTVATGTLGGGGSKAMAFAACAPAGGSRGMDFMPDGADYESFGEPDFEEAAVVEAAGMQRLVCPEPVAELGAKRSTLVFMFSRELGEANTVLVYREMNGAKPDRAFRIKNTTGLILPKGPVSIDTETPSDPAKPDGPSDLLGMGKAILEATQPGEERMVVYATDMNVVVRCERKPMTTEVLNVKFSEGVGYCQSECRAVSEYRVTNVGPAVELYIDHYRSMRGSTVTSKSADVEKLSDGYSRVKVSLANKTDSVVLIEEVFRNTTSVVLSTSGGNTNRAGGLLTMIGHSSDRLLSNPKVKAALDIATEIDAKNREIQTAQQKKTRLESQHARAKSTLEALKPGDDGRNTAVNLLNDSSSKLNAVEDEELPALHEQKNALETRYNAALKTLAVEWKGGREGESRQQDGFGRSDRRHLETPESIFGQTHIHFG